MVALGALRTGSWRKHLVVDKHGLASPLIPEAIIVCGNTRISVLDSYRKASAGWN